MPLPPSSAANRPAAEEQQETPGLQMDKKKKKSEGGGSRTHLKKCFVERIRDIEVIPASSNDPWKKEQGGVL